MRAALVALSLIGCTGADMFYVRADGADLPVWVRGNAESDQVVVFQHGSGSSGMLYDWLPSFDAIEEHVRVVYWDQRGGGFSQGNPAPNGMDLDGSVADLELVLDVVEERLAPGRLVLMGHSLGGGISQAYLRDPDRRARVDAYVDVSGGRSLPESYTVVADRISTWATSNTLGNDHFADVLAYYEQQTSFPREEPARSEHAAYVEEYASWLGFDMAASVRSQTAFLAGRGVREAWLGPFDPLAFLVNTSRFVSTYDLDGVDLGTDDVAGIDVPALVVAGRFDLSVPVEVSQASYAAFGKNHDQSRLVVLERSGHFPMWDEPDAFSAAVRDFLDGLP